MKKSLLQNLFILLALLLTASCGKSAEEAVELVDQNRFQNTQPEKAVILNVQVEKAASQASFTTTLPISYTIKFSQDIWPETFDASDITQAGTATGVVWNLTNSGDNTNYTLTATASTTEGTIIPTIEADQAKTGGGSNKVSTSTDNTVTLDTTEPVVAITSPTGVEWYSNSITIDGTCDEDSTIAIAVDALNSTTNCTDGSFSTTVDITTVNEALAINVSATPTDLAGNIGVVASQSFNKDVTAPTVPGALDITANDATCEKSVTTNWTASNDTASGLSHYEIAIGSSNTTQDFLDWKDIGDILSYSPSRPVDFSSTIPLDTDHYVFLRAVDNAGNVSNEVVSGSFQFNGVDTINNLIVVSTLSNGAHLSWSTPTNNGASTLTDYLVEFKETSSGTWTNFNDVVSTSTTADVTGLNSDVSYDFRVSSYFCTNTSTPSNTATASTKPNHPIFNSKYKAMNVGGATRSTVVALEDSTTIELNSAFLITLNAGQTHAFNSTQFDIIDADKPIYTSGLRGLAGNPSDGANIVWQPTTWAGKEFVFTADRSNPQHFKIYAIEDTTVTVTQGATTLATVTLLAGQSSDESWNVYGSYQVNSTGYILGFHISTDAPGGYYDPTPTLPSSNEIIGFPSKTMRLAAMQDSTNYTLLHSNSSTTSSSLNKADSHEISAQGTNGEYLSESLLISSNKPVAGASYADGNGYCSAPFLPTTLMKKNFAIPVSAGWIAFASKEAGTIDVIDTLGAVVQTLTLTRSGGDNTAPYKVRATALPAGYRFSASVNVGAWFQPNTSTSAGDQDESILYGFD